MLTKTESKKQQWMDSISSSRCSSITSASSDGHFDIRHFPLLKTTMSAQKQNQAYNSSVSSYIGSSCSTINRNNLVDLPGYDPNRIPSSVFSSKPDNSMEWSITSNESLFSIHDGNFRISTSENHGLDSALKLSDIQRFEETVYEITEINPVKKQEEYEVYDDKEEEEEEKMIELESDDEDHYMMIKPEFLVETESEKQEVVKDVKENKVEDSNTTPSHSQTISCLSNTSICSFPFTELQKETEMPFLDMKGNDVSKKQRAEYMLTLTRHYSESKTLPQRKALKQYKCLNKSTKPWRNNGWFSCFRCNSKRGLFK